MRPLGRTLAAFAFALGTANAAPDPAVMSFKMPEDIKWVENPAYLGLKSAVVHGDPSKPGPYAVLNHFSRNTFSHPHFHPNDRFILVLKGTWWVGTSDKFDPSITTPLPAGSFAVHNAGKVHWDGAKDEECDLLIYGEGPATSTRVPEH